MPFGDTAMDMEQGTSNKGVKAAIAVFVLLAYVATCVWVYGYGMASDFDRSQLAKERESLFVLTLAAALVGSILRGLFREK